MRPRKVRDNVRRVDVRPGTVCNASFKIRDSMRYVRVNPDQRKYAVCPYKARDSAQHESVRPETVDNLSV